MSDIHYDVWGSPIQWGLSTNPTTETLFGAARTGALSWSDNDFTDYPSFKISDKTNLRNLLVNSMISLNTPLDSSLSYTAVANPALPQTNIYLMNSMHYSTSDYIAKNKEQIMPFSLAYWYRNDTMDAPSVYGQLRGFDGFPDNAGVINTEKLQRFSPMADYDTVYTNVYGDYNPILRIAPVLEFGIKSVILEIHVVYTDYDTTSARSTLGSYLSNSDTWIENHPIHSAFCIPYFRTNKNGTYNRAKINASTRFSGICPVFYSPYHLMYSDTDIYNYLQAYTYGDSGMIPLYGTPVNDSFYSSIGVTCSRVADSDITRTYMSDMAIVYGADRGTITATGSDSSRLLYMSLDMSITDNVEYIMRAAAAYGLFFCTDIGTLGDQGRDTGLTERWIDNDMYLGVIASDGCTYGDYTHGADNALQQQYGWKSSTETPYVPGGGSDPNSYSNQTKFNIISPTVQMTKQYVLNAVNVAKLANDLWSITATLSSSQTDFTDFEGKVKDEFLTNDPLECIVSLRRFPFDIEHEASSVNVKLGKTAGSAVGYQNKYSSAEFSFRPVQIYPRFGNSFLDYAPYTEYELYVPFCGVTKIDAADILGHTLNVKMIADLTTGSCTAFIMADDLVIQSLSGSVAVEIPVTGTDAATINSQIMNGILNNERAQNQAKTALASIFTPSGFVKNIASFGMSAAKENIAAAENVKKADYDLTHINAPVHTIGSASALEKWYIDLQCRLLIYYPEGDAVTSAIPPDLNSAVIAEYGATTGFATVEEGKIEDYAGLTVAVNPVLNSIVTGTQSVPASSRELEMIEEALSEGVIV